MLSHNIDTMETATSSSESSLFHNLSDKWTLWAHLPHNTDWSISSYIPIITVTTIEETLAVTETIPPILVENCVLFVNFRSLKSILLIVVCCSSLIMYYLIITNYNLLYLNCLHYF